MDGPALHSDGVVDLLILAFVVIILWYEKFFFGFIKRTSDLEAV